VRRHALATVAYAAIVGAAIGVAPLVGLAQLRQQPPVAAKPAVDLPTEIRTQVGTMYPDLEALYRDLHSHPELGFKETRTAARLAAEMKVLGFDVTEGVGKTGVVAILRNGSGPTVMVRTELDALPMEEKTGLPFSSQVKAEYNGREGFVAHSCGHDVHMTSWVGTARALATNKRSWQGTLMFVAQPAEETVNGARAMLEDGLFTRFPKPDFAFALHTSPLPHGMVGYNFGAMTSNADIFDITFKGRGGHGSAPHLAIDPITIAARFVVDVQTIISREKDPMEFGVITVGAINAGTADNIIPDSAVLRGTIRSYRSDVRDRLLAGVRRTAQAAALVAAAAEPEVRLTEGGSAIVGSDELVSRTERVLTAVLGAENVVKVPPITASEDFSAYLQQGVPGMFFFIGVHDSAAVAEAGKPGGKALPFNHSPFFAPVAEPTIRTGVMAMTAAVLNVMARD
jgi:hippurate hydrolase